MGNLNSVVLIGRLTRNVELKYTINGQAICKFTVAVNRSRKDGDRWVDEANFFDVVLWGKQAEALSQYLVKGKQICVQGELKQERWEKDGRNYSKVEIIANTIQLLGDTTSGNKENNGTAKSVSGFEDDIIP